MIPQIEFKVYRDCGYGKVYQQTFGTLPEAKRALKAWKEQKKSGEFYIRELHNGKPQAIYYGGE